MKMKEDILDWKLNSIARAAFPLILSQAAFLLAQLSDVWMVSRLGSVPLAATGSSMLIVVAVFCFGSGYLTSVSAWCGQACGAGMPRLSSNYAIQGIWAACLIGFGAISLAPVGEKIFRLIGHEPQIQHLEIIYFQLSMVAILPQMVSVAINYYFLSVGCFPIVASGAVLLVFSNIVFNYLLIFGAFGIPALGVTGAALGTMLAAGVHSIFLFLLFALKLSAQGGAYSFRPRFDEQKDLAKLGAPAGIQDAIEWGMLGLVVVILVGKFGENDLAATAVLLRCMQICVLPADGVGLVLMAKAANLFGAEQTNLARSLVNRGLVLVACYMVGSAFLIYLFRGHVMGIFSNNAAVIAIGLNAMIFVFIFQVFDSLNVTFSYALQGVGDCLWPSALNLLLTIIVMFGGGGCLLYGYFGLESYCLWFLAASVSALQGMALWARWNFGPWDSTNTRVASKAVSSQERPEELCSEEEYSLNFRQRNLWFPTSVGKSPRAWNRATR